MYVYRVYQQRIVLYFLVRLPDNGQQSENKEPCPLVFTVIFVFCFSSLMVLLFKQNKKYKKQSKRAATTGERPETSHESLTHLY